MKCTSSAPHQNEISALLVGPHALTHILIPTAITIGFEEVEYTVREPGVGQTQGEVEVCMIIMRGNLAQDLVVVPRYVARTARGEFHRQ